MAPDDHSAAAPVSSLCKLLFWHQQGYWQKVSLNPIGRCFSPVQCAESTLSEHNKESDGVRQLVGVSGA